MQIRTIDNIKVVNSQPKLVYKNLNKNITTQPSSNVVSYSAENVRANYMVPSFSSRMSELDYFVNFLSDTVANDDSLLRQISDYSFQYDRNFDIEGWTDLIYTLSTSDAVFASGKKKPFLDILMEDYSISDLMNSKGFDASKAFYFLNEYFSRDIVHFNTFSPKNTLNFMVDFAMSNSDDEKEYVDNILYFRNLKTKSGDNIFENEYGQFGDFQYNAVKHILGVHPSSVEISNLEMLLSLVENEVVDKHVFRDLPLEGRIALPIVDDITTLYDAYLEKKDPIDVFVPTFADVEEAKDFLKVGDVFELKGHKNIFILDKDGETTQLKMDKPTYFKLFPPIERYATSQNQIGNCWELAAINSLLCDPEERSKFLSLYEQDGDDILVVFPRTGNKTRFKEGKLPPDAKDSFYSFGAQGVRLLEYAHGKELYSQKIFELYRILSDSINNARTYEERTSLEQTRDCLDELIKQKKEAIYYGVRDDGSYEFSEWESSEKAEHYDSPYSYSRDGGYAIDMYYNLGYDTKLECIDEENDEAKFVSPQLFIDNVVSYATPCSEERGERTQDGRFHMSHVYRILPERINEQGLIQEFKLVDPHSIVEVNVTPSDLKKYGGEFYLARKTKKQGPSFKGTREEKVGFMNFINKESVGNKRIVDYIKDYSFTSNPNFDSKAWKDLFKSFRKTQIHFNTGEKVVLLDEIVKKPMFSKMLNSKDFKPERAHAYIQEYLRNIELNQNFSLDENIELMSFFATSDYDISEFLDTISYFSNLKTKDGQKVLDERITIMEFIDILKYLLNVNKRSVEASNIELLLSLAVDGVVGPYIFTYLPEKGKLSHQIVQDIDKFYGAHIDGVNPIDVFIPTYKTIDEAERKTMPGDVFEVEGQRNIHIKTSAKTSKQLGIPKQVYFDLFPPIERFATTQFKIGNCWELTGFNALYSDVDTRADILSMFSYDEKQNVLFVEFSNGVAGKVRFENCELPESANRDYFSRGAKGIQMLEYVHGKEIHEERVRKLYKQLTDERRRTGSYESLVKLLELDRLYLDDKENLVVAFDAKNKKWTFHKWNAERDGFGNAEILTRHYGQSSKLFNKLGYSTKNYTIADSAKILANPKTFKENIIKYGTDKKEILTPEEKALGILPTHAYRLLPATVNRRGKVIEYYLQNPMGIMQTKVSYEQLQACGGSITLAKKKL